MRYFIPRPVINYSKHLPLAVLANFKYGFPGRKLKVIGVTGTDGKTTTVNMIYQILKDAGKCVSMISTINAIIGGKEYDTGFHVTSPEPKMIQKFLRLALNHGDQFMVLEVTSHALDQFRVWGIPFEIGVITNITHEHLDYHKTFANYFNTKLKLVRNAKVAIINQLIKESWDSIGRQVISFGLNKGDFNQDQIGFKLKIPGDYNIENALAALAVASVLGIDQKNAKLTLENFSNLSGRMEEVKNNKGIKIVVDFAHTPNALENALKTLRLQTTGKLISVFGCAAQRDREKRPIMGGISGNLADITILTDEDPRYEDSNKIIEEIAQGVGDNKLYKEPDREKAIKLAINLANRGDVIGIFGKGHEKSMNYQGEELAWSDTSTVKKILQNE